MPGSRVKTTTRVTSRVNGRMGTKDKVRTSSFYVQPSPAANKGKGVRIDVQPQAFDALFTEPERFKKLLETYGEALTQSSDRQEGSLRGCRWAKGWA